MAVASINYERVYGKKIGLSREEFVKEYMYVFKRGLGVKERVLTDQQKEELEKEKRYAIYIYHDFIENYGYGVPSHLVEGMAIRSFQERKHLYVLHKKEVMTKEHFAILFIQFLEEKQWLTIRKFGEDDFQSVKQTIFDTVQHAFEKLDIDESYPELRISRNAIEQKRLFKHLLNQFIQKYPQALSKQTMTEELFVQDFLHLLKNRRFLSEEMLGERYSELEAIAKQIAQDYYRKQREKKTGKELICDTQNFEKMFEKYVDYI